MKNNYQILDDKCFVFLGAGLETIIDKEDFDLINSFSERWVVHREVKTKACYCKIRQSRPGRKEQTMRMSRVILGVSNPELVVDHINHNTLDNTRTNLRSVTRRQNSHNQIKPHVNNKSGFIGVSRHQNAFIAQVNEGKRKIYLGSFSTPEEAAQRYQEYKQSHGLVKQGAYGVACF